MKITDTSALGEALRYLREERSHYSYKNDYEYMFITDQMNEIVNLLISIHTEEYNQ